MKSDNYYVIQGWMRSELGLKGNDLLVYAIVYGFCQDRKSVYEGGYSYLMACTGASKATISDVVKRLEKGGFIKKVPVTIKNVKFINLVVTEPLYQNPNGGVPESERGVPESEGHIHKDNIINNIDIRKEKFKKSLIPYLEKYGKDMLNEFYSYWTEHGENDKKMRFEKEKSFGLGRRLSTWKRNESRFSQSSIQTQSNVVSGINVGSIMGNNGN